MIKGIEEPSLLVLAIHSIKIIHIDKLNLIIMITDKCLCGQE